MADLFLLNHKGHREHRGRGRSAIASSINFSLLIDDFFDRDKHFEFKRDRIPTSYKVNANHPDFEFNPEQVYRAKADEEI